MDSTALVVSNSGTGDGQVIQTPFGHPDILVKVITPLAAILIRAAKAYLQTLVGLLGAGALGMASNTLPPGDFFHTLKICAGLSVAAGVMSILTNLLLFLTNLGDSFPTLKA